MRTLVSILILTLTLVTSVSAFAQSDAQSGVQSEEAESDKSQMLSALRAIDAVPTREALQEKFPDGESLLLEIATDSEHNLYIRKRATTLLSAYPTTGALSALETIAADARLRPFAVYTMARTFGPNATAALVGKVAAYLDDEDAEVRRYAVRGLRWMQHDSARTALHEVATSHDDDGLRSLARRGLKRWKPAPNSPPVY